MIQSGPEETAASPSTERSLENLDARLQEQIAGLSERGQLLFAAQLAFEWNAILDASTTADELDRLFDWLCGNSLAEWLTAENRAAIAARLREAVLEHKVSPEELARGARVASALHGVLMQSDAKTGDLIHDAAMDELIAELSENESLRNAAIDSLSENPVVAEIASEVLLQGIADFMKASQSNMTNSIPGAGSLFALGQSLLNQTVPGLSDGLQKSIKEFIRDNITRIVQSSEPALRKSLTPEVLQDAARQMRQDLAGVPVNDFAAHFESEISQRQQSALIDLCNHLRQTTLARDLLDTAAATIMDMLAQASPGELMSAAGVDRERFIREGQELLATTLRDAASADYLYALLARRLLAFYASPAARDLLS